MEEDHPGVGVVAEVEDHPVAEEVLVVAVDVMADAEEEGVAAVDVVADAEEEEVAVVVEGVAEEVEAKAE